MIIKAITVTLSLIVIYKTVVIVKNHFKNNSSPIHIKNKIKKQAPDIILNQTDMHLFGNSKLKNCRIKAEKSKLFQSDNKTECDIVECKLTTNRDNVVTLNSPHANIDNTKKEVFLPGKVTGSFKEWDLEKQDVIYNSSDHTIISKNIKLYSESGISIQANESVFELKEKRILLKNNIFCEIIQRN